MLVQKGKAPGDVCIGGAIVGGIEGPEDKTMPEPHPEQVDSGSKTGHRLMYESSEYLSESWIVHSSELE